jgi:taurine dioxygenase
MSVAARHDYATLSVDPLSPTIGAEIGGFRMNGDLPEEQIAEIRWALLE